MKNNTILPLIAIFAFLAIMFVMNEDKKEKEKIQKEESALQFSIDEMECDTLIAMNGDYSFLKNKLNQNDTISLESTHYIVNRKSKEDYIIRNSQSFIELSILSDTLKVKKHCESNFN